MNEGELVVVFCRHLQPVRFCCIAHRRIDIFELGEWAQSLGLRNLTFEDLKRMIAEVDTNHDGRVDFWEFLAIQLYITMNLSGLAPRPF